jgi:hypothetical protein
MKAHVAQKERSKTNHLDDCPADGKPRCPTRELRGYGQGDAYSHDPHEARKHQISNEETIPSSVLEKIVATGAIVHEYHHKNAHPRIFLKPL